MLSVFSWTSFGRLSLLFWRFFRVLSVLILVAGVSFLGGFFFASCRSFCLIVSFGRSYLLSLLGANHSSDLGKELFAS